MTGLLFDRSEVEVFRSAYENQDELLRAIRDLHIPDGFEVDATYGMGNFWRTLPRPPRCFDIDPQFPFVEKACSTMLPLESGSVGSIVFDPPFLTYVRNAREHKDGAVVMTRRFGGYWRYDELEEHYRHSISEAYRVLRAGGKLVFKCQDIIHNHRMHCTHFNVMLMAEIEGFRLLDLFVLVAKHRMPSPQRGKQRHARVFHSYFLVFEK